ENENDYKRLNLEEERGKTVSGDLASYLDGLWVNLGKPLSERAVFERFLAKTADKVKLYEGADGKHVKKLLSLLEESDFELPHMGAAAPLPDVKSVPSSYLSARKKDPRDVGVYIAEAKRRSEQKDEIGAARALSCVVEQYPGRADAL